jgi:galactokinase
MNESHASLRDMLEVSVPEIDAMVRDAVDLGAYGARITGAGFGGCFVCLIDSSRADAWWTNLHKRHPGMKRIS